MSRLEVITGPMFSGKTEELLRRLRREEIAGKKVILFKPQIDDRFGHTEVKTHSGTSRYCYSVQDSFAMHEMLVHSYPEIDVVGVDEAQFFDGFLPAYLSAALADKRKIIVSGLATDFAVHGFGEMPRLMLMADRLDKLTAVCNKCGADDASFTQRLVDGKPAAFDGPTILVGGTESYEARCRDCFEIG
jgi:thymidine kinase